MIQNNTGIEGAIKPAERCQWAERSQQPERSFLLRTLSLVAKSVAAPLSSQRGWGHRGRGHRCTQLDSVCSESESVADPRPWHRRQARGGDGGRADEQLGYINRGAGKPVTRTKSKLCAKSTRRQDQARIVVRPPAKTLYLGHTAQTGPCAGGASPAARGGTSPGTSESQFCDSVSLEGPAACQESPLTHQPGHQQSMREAEQYSALV
mmetsp:Transcript_59751/g.124868  ORF Transcript_59751/g.124868 Transcript_59751/m.124868 type:complete len:208 (+) Transcript_59751:259-882(+)